MQALFVISGLKPADVEQPRQGPDLDVHSSIAPAYHMRQRSPFVLTTRRVFFTHTDAKEDVEEEAATQNGRAGMLASKVVARRSCRVSWQSQLSGKLDQRPGLP